MTTVKNRFIVNRGNEYFILRAEDICYIYRNDLIIMVVDKENKKYFYDKSLNEIEKDLDPKKFFRANRKYIINIDYIKCYKPLDKVKLEVIMNPLQVNSIVISQENSPLFKKWVEEV